MVVFLSFLRRRFLSFLPYLPSSSLLLSRDMAVPAGLHGIAAVVSSLLPNAAQAPSLVIASLLYTISYDSLQNLPSHTPSEPRSLFSLFDLFQASLLLGLILSIFLFAFSLSGAEKAPGYLITWFQGISCIALVLIFLCRFFLEFPISLSLLRPSCILLVLLAILAHPFVFYNPIKES